MTDEDIIRFWGEPLLIRWRPDVVEKTSLPLEAKKFLTAVGLPRGIAWSIEFGTEGGLLPQAQKHPGCYIVGRDVGIICVDATTNGQIVLADIDPKSGRERIVFINSNIRLFAEFLILYQKYRLVVESLSDKEARTVVTATKRQMKVCDPAALNTPGAFWPAIIEEMYVGWM
jgi:hypothetical protein